MTKERASEIILDLIIKEENDKCSIGLSVSQINELKKAYCALKPQIITNSDSE